MNALDRKRSAVFQLLFLLSVLVVPAGNAAAANNSDGVVTGAVTAADSGAALDSYCGLHIRILPAHYNSAWYYFYISRKPPVATFSGCLDANGRYSISVPAGSYIAAVSDGNDRYAPGWANSDSYQSPDQTPSPFEVTAGQTVDVGAALDKAGTVRGVISDARTGNAIINDCRTTLHFSYGGDEQAGFHFPRRVCTDAKGGYVVRGLPPTIFAVQFTYPHKLAEWWPNTVWWNRIKIFRVEPGRAVNHINESFVRGGSISARMFQASNRQALPRCDYGTVRVDLASDRDAFNDNTLIDLDSSPDGSSFVARHLPPGRYKLATSEGSSPPCWDAQYYDQTQQWSSARVVIVRSGQTTTLTWLVKQRAN